MVNDDLLIFFARSKLRVEVLKKLNEKPQIASFLAQALMKHREVISRVFLDLHEKGLAECKNPESPHFRYYKITKKGQNVLKEIVRD
ncbi:MAG: hypothetical protein ACFE85_19395 [Candidatus Hodarchaeota archaeon]